MYNNKQIVHCPEVGCLVDLICLCLFIVFFPISLFVVLFIILIGNAR